MKIIPVLLAALLLNFPSTWAQARTTGESVLIPSGQVRARTFDRSNQIIEVLFSLTYVDYTDLLYLNLSTPQRSMVVEIEPVLYYPLVSDLLDWSVGIRAETSREYRTFPSMRVAWRTGSAVAGAISDVNVRFSVVDGEAAAVFILDNPNVPFRTIVLDADRRLVAR